MAKPVQTPQTQAASAPTPATGPMPRRLRKGELIFSEGEKSRSMYFLKSGMIRIFKRKGNTQIELDTIHSGQVLGELAFLDGNPRSASGEALVDCDLVEISVHSFQQELSRTPEWLKILLKAIVGRLRAASTRIRQLESASSGVDYSDKSGGVRASNYLYLSTTDVMKILSAVFLVGSREKAPGTSVELPMSLLNRYGNQIMGIPEAKITSLLAVLETVGLTTLSPKGDRAFAHDLPFIEKLIGYLNTENVAEPSKRHDLTARAFAVMGMIVNHLDQFKKEPDSDITRVNLALIKELESSPEKREPFRMDDFMELVNVGYCTALDIKSLSEMFTKIETQSFLLHYRFQAVATTVAALNEQKRSAIFAAA
ncbi:MAG: cyclic nucleotide-binding domain-containing protein [Oligoflexia bacterium]|nr:cyclic nucleotide-binding domain-containing protein [Oligoflexia bacterium]